jgi:toxin ParE1/3/4
MSPYVLSVEVFQDLQDIWDFIASDNVVAADRLEDEFFEAFEMLATRPRMGHSRSDLTDRDVRFWPVGEYLIVYRSLPASLQVVAVLHGARDIVEVLRKR